jgi:hypothetical protein
MKNLLIQFSMALYVIIGLIIIGICYYAIFSLIVHAETTTLTAHINSNPCNTAMAHAREVCQEYK